MYNWEPSSAFVHDSTDPSLYFLPMVRRYYDDDDDNDKRRGRYGSDSDSEDSETDSDCSEESYASIDADSILPMSSDAARAMEDAVDEMAMCNELFRSWDAELKR